MGKISSFFIANETNNFEPPALSYKAFLVYGAFLLAARFFLPGVPAASGADVESQTLMNLINQERAARNLNTLYTNQKLLVAAGQKSDDMIARDYFAHVDPDGSYVWGRIVAASYAPYKILGENLAINFNTSEGMVKAWMGSSKHRENLLHEEFVDQGLSAKYGDYQGRYTNLTTSLFGALAAGTSESTVKAAVKEDTAPSKTTGQSAVIKNSSEPPQTPPSGELSGSQPPLFSKERAGVSSPITQVVFTVIGLFLLAILAIDSVIIFRRKFTLPRSHSAYHLFSFFLLAVLSITIWWW